MKTIRVNVTAEDIAAADSDGNMPRAMWWDWPVKRALEGLIGEDVDMDGDADGSYIATIGARDDSATLVIGPFNAVAFLDARFDRDIPGEPFFFELTLPDWLCALVERTA